MTLMTEKDFESSKGGVLYDDSNDVGYAASGRPIFTQRGRAKKFRGINQPFYEYSQELWYLQFNLDAALEVDEKGYTHGFWRHQEVDPISVGSPAGEDGWFPIERQDIYSIFKELERTSVDDYWMGRSLWRRRLQKIRFCGDHSISRDEARELMLLNYEGTKVKFHGLAYKDAAVKNILVVKDTHVVQVIDFEDVHEPLSFPDWKFLRPGIDRPIEIDDLGDDLDDFDPDKWPGLWLD